MATTQIEQLSPRSRAILTRIVEPISEGWKETELAEKLGRTPSWVSERLSELRQEILLQNGVFPPLTEQEYGALRESVRHHGIRVPILVDADLRIIDGRHRLLIAEELQVGCRYEIVDVGDDEKRELMVALNAARRQLNRFQRRKLVEAELMRDPARSDRRIAGICGVSHPTVSEIRSEIAAAEEALRGPAPTPALVESLTSSPAPPVEAPTATVAPPVRVDARGARRPAPPPRPAPEVTAPRPLAVLDCAGCGAPLELWRDGSGYRLEHQTT